jgi:activating signal cointegrator complex subunit 3
LLIATSTLIWNIIFLARLIIIKATELFDPKTHRYVGFPATNLLQMMRLAGRPQFDNKGMAVVYWERSKNIFSGVA